jgi:uncharacterized membrane protein (UPF0127 family)
MKRIIIVIIFFVTIMVADEKYIPIYVGENELVVEVADTLQKRMTGLMFRKSIPDDYGMLFVFETESTQAMWMKNTFIHLDIIFLNKHRQIIDIYLNVPPCEQEPCMSYVSRSPAKYALELKGNYSKKLNIGIGDSIFFVGE